MLSQEDDSRMGATVHTSDGKDLNEEMRSSGGLDCACKNYFRTKTPGPGTVEYVRRGRDGDF